MGSWEADLVAWDVRWDEKQYELFGVPKHTKITPELWWSLIHPDDVEKVKVATAASFLTKELNVEFRIIRPDGVVRWLGCRGASLPNQHKMLGVNFDLTDKYEQDQVEVVATCDQLETVNGTRLMHQLLKVIGKSAAESGAVIIIPYESLSTAIMEDSAVHLRFVKEGVEIKTTMTPPELKRGRTRRLDV